MRMELQKAAIRLFEKLVYSMAILSGLITVLMMIIMLSDAIGRSISKPVPGAFETSLVFMVWIAYLPMAYVQLQGGHVSVDLFSKRFPAKIQTAINGVGEILGAVVLGLVVYVSSRQAWESTVTREYWMGLMEYPVWPFRWIIPVGVGLMVIQFIRSAVSDFRKACRGK